MRGFSAPIQKKTLVHFIIERASLIRGYILFFRGMSTFFEMFIGNCIAVWHLFDDRVDLFLPADELMVNTMGFPARTQQVRQQLH